MNFKKKVLKNGLRIIAIPIKGAPSVTVMSLVEAGSKYESKTNNGISHFLEHMCFKGTDKRPNSADIAKEFDGMGAANNAFTGEEITGYWGKAHPKHFSNILDLIADMYMNPTFPSNEIEKEKGVIVEEINMYEDLPHIQVHEVLGSLLYGDQPAGWSIAGTRDNVKSFNRDDFLNYRKGHYVAGATTIIVAGDVNSTTVFKEVDKAFKKIPTGKKVSKKITLEKQTKPEVKSKFKETDQTHLVIAVRTFDMYDKRSATLNLLSTILGNGMSSRLFQKMRDQLGICYYVRATPSEQTDTGALVISAGVDSNRVEEGVAGILSEMKKIRDEKVDLSEIRKAKDYSIGHLYLGLESSDSLADFYGFQEIFKKKIKTPKEIEKEIEKVTAEDIQKLAKEIMRNDKLNMAIVGKYTQKDDERFRKILSL